MSDVINLRLQVDATKFHLKVYQRKGIIQEKLFISFINLKVYRYFFHRVAGWEKRNVYSERDRVRALV